MKSKAIYYLLLGGMLFGFGSCMRDDLDAEAEPIGKGESRVSFAVTFQALSNLSLGKTRSLKGDQIAEIEDIFIAWYNEDGSLAGSGYRTREQMKISNPEREGNPTEQTTQRAEFTYNIPYGRYRIYAVANMGDLAANTRYAEKIALEEDFRRIAPAWETDPELTRNNDQMSGYFTANKPESGAVRGEAPLLTINSAKPTIHAWLRRLASKVTISFDTKNLYDNVYIYIKSARIHNIPRSCTLLDANDEQRIKDPDNDVWFAGDTIEYGQGTDFNQWPRQTKGSNPLGGTAQSKEQLHANDARSLFF